MTSCGAQICKPCILFNLCAMCSLLLAFTNVMHGYSLTIPLKCDLCLYDESKTRGGNWIPQTTAEFHSHWAY
jgi:hypothetical protein